MAIKSAIECLKGCWWYDFNPIKQSSILLRTWPCRIFYYAQEKYRKGLIMNGKKQCY
jgi:hypothetical protein